MDDDLAFLTFIALVVDDDEVMGELEKDDRRRHQCWVRPWIARRTKCDTAFTLLRELQAVGKIISKSAWTMCRLKY